MSEFGEAFDKAQARYDAMDPEDHHDCKEDGHVWKRIRSSPDGEVTLYRCKYCGEEEVS